MRSSTAAFLVSSVFLDLRNSSVISSRQLSMRERNQSLADSSSLGGHRARTTRARTEGSFSLNGQGSPNPSDNKVPTAASTHSSQISAFFPRTSFLTSLKCLLQNEQCNVTTGSHSAITNLQFVGFAVIRLCRCVQPNYNNLYIKTRPCCQSFNKQGATLLTALRGFEYAPLLKY